jgi:cytochrome c-type biogenesis protein
MESATQLSLIIAAGAGVISFLSPCVLPLFPSYLAYIAGVPLSDLQTGSADRGVRMRVLRNALGFIAGFSLIFIALGASASVVGQLFFPYRLAFQKIGGALIIIFGLYIAGLLKLPALAREWRPMKWENSGGFFGSVLVGMTFSSGWTPCIGPILGSILVLAGTGKSVGEGTLLLGAYAFGLAVPFFLSALAVHRFLRFFARFKRAMSVINAVAGGMLVLVGVLIFSGYFTLLNGYLIQLTPRWLLQLL